uniref:Uncharacterized protein n=1 Tax=Anguilla anguilla TaxID=7936 RepID=A0A0E9WAN3_ANGAN
MGHYSAFLYEEHPIHKLWISKGWYSVKRKSFKLNEDPIKKMFTHKSSHPQDFDLSSL